MELLVAARVDAFHQRYGIIDEIVHVAVLRNDLLGELLQYVFVGNVAHKVVALLLINHADLRSSLQELFGNATANALCATCHYGNFVLEILHVYRFVVNLLSCYSLHDLATDPKEATCMQIK